MTDLKSRIKIIEKKVIPKQEKEIIPILAKGWRENGKIFYENAHGEKVEFIQSEHKETPIFTFMTNEAKDLIGELYENGGIPITKL